MASLRKEIDSMKVSTSSASSSVSIDPSANACEVVIGGFGLKSKHGACTLVMSILANVNGNSCIVDHCVARVPKVISVLFDSSASAQSFVASARKTGGSSYEGF